MYEHVPKLVEAINGGKVTKVWNQQVLMERTAPNNKQDVVIRDNEKLTFKSTVGAISGDRNVTKKETEKILKYKELTI